MFVIIEMFNSTPNRVYGPFASGVEAYHKAIEMNHLNTDKDFTYYYKEIHSPNKFQKSE